MILDNNSLVKITLLPSHTCGRGAGGEGVFGLPGVARRLVTFFCFAKKKVTKDNEVAVEANMRSMLCRSQKATPIRHLCEVPCVAQQPRRLRNSHCVLRQSWLRHNLKVSLRRNKSLRAVLSPTPPELSPLLGGGTGEGEARRVQWMGSIVICTAKGKGLIL